jgi:predicted metal-dependent enzyme (double-stranded beta helix superfamily)
MERLEEFVGKIEKLVDAGHDERGILKGARAAMRELVSRDDWLPEEMTRPHPDSYQQYLLYADPRDRFSVVSFVWGPGQKTPVHDHTVWGVIGVLRGAERCEEFASRDGRVVQDGAAHLLERGDVEAVGPSVGDIHRVSNAYDDRVTISIHAYGGNIGKVRRHVFDVETGAAREFVSGYSNA